MTWPNSWNEEINRTLAVAGVTFHDVPVYPEFITVDFGENIRHIYKTSKNYLYVLGFDKKGRSTTHFVDRDTWRNL